MRVATKIRKRYALFLTFSFLIACSPWITGGSSLAKEPDAREPVCPQYRNTPRAPSEFLKLKNPLELTYENIAEGKKMFLGKVKPIPCIVCHGKTGNGLGDPDFESFPPARNFTCSETMEKIPDGQLFWVLNNGVPRTAMPSFADLPEEKIWQLILYVRQFAK